MRLNANNVRVTFEDCLYEDDDNDHSNARCVRGMVTAVGFNPESLLKNEQDVRDMLGQLPVNFLSQTEDEDGGEGWSTSKAILDRNDNIWGGHREVDQLICLGLALNLVKYLLPRQFWSTLPNGMPYILVTSKNTFEEKDQENPEMWMSLAQVEKQEALAKISSSSKEQLENLG